MPIEIPRDDWPGAVKTVTLGATAQDGGTRTSTVTIGGERTLPFLHFEEAPPHRPVIALEITPARPNDWSAALLEAWGEVAEDPGSWAAAGDVVYAILPKEIVFLNVITVFLLMFQAM